MEDELVHSLVSQDSDRDDNVAKEDEKEEANDDDVFALQLEEE